MRRRSRSPKVVWLPQTNANSIGVNNELVYQLFTITTPGGFIGTGGTATDEIPLVLDSQQSAVADPASLADINSSGYRLRRIVGKIWVIAGQTGPSSSGDPEAHTTSIVSAGIIVRHAETTTGQSMAELSGSDIGPGAIDNTGDPWVWRRSWIIGNRWAGDNVATVSGSGIQFSHNWNPDNWTHGPAAVDGPHVDQKTARVVGPEERLYLTVSATTAGESSFTSAGLAEGMTIAVFTDLRVLGSLRTMAGNRRNASR